MIDPREELKAYLDGELPFEESEQVRVALEGDATLAQEAAQLRALSHALAQERALEPVGLERTLEVLKARRQKREPWWSIPQILIPSTFASVAAIVLVSFFVKFLVAASQERPTFAAASYKSMSAFAPEASVQAKAAPPRLSRNQATLRSTPTTTVGDSARSDLNLYMARTLPAELPFASEADAMKQVSHLEKFGKFRSIKRSSVGKTTVLEVHLSDNSEVEAEVIKISPAQSTGRATLPPCLVKLYLDKDGEPAPK